MLSRPEGRARRLVMAGTQSVRTTHYNMTEAGIGRLLPASLHQAIADVLPTRLEFYEAWVNPAGLRIGDSASDAALRF